MTPVWSDNPTIGIRFNQSGYSSPTVFPQAENYTDLTLYAIDLAKAEIRQDSHLEWVWEQQEEARQEWYELQQETKAEREDY